MAKHTFSGNFRQDGAGRVVVDACASDRDHLTLPRELPEGQDRHRCRRLVEEAFAPYLGRRGTLELQVVFVPDPEPRPGDQYKSLVSGNVFEIERVELGSNPKSVVFRGGGWVYLDELLDLYEPVPA